MLVEVLIIPQKKKKRKKNLNIFWGVLFGELKYQLFMQL